MRKYKKALVWLRRDLRLHDQAALSHASESADSIALCFTFDRRILARFPRRNDRRLSFIHGSLEALNASLREYGSRLIILHGDSQDEIPRLAAKWGAEAVFTNRDYEPHAQLRDAAVAQNLRSEGRHFHHYKDQVIFENREVLTENKTPYRVFTPYKNSWLKQLSSEATQEYQARPRAFAPATDLRGLGLTNWDLDSLGYEIQELWLKPGEAAARKRLKDFKKALPDYKKNRDYPGLEGTSGLSVHLRFGTISIRECVRTALASHSAGADTWLSELIWRDFYQMVLANFPEVENQAFQKQYESISWPGREEHFQAWCKGETGYPLVDAAMRHLNATGWMHNRLRMVVAMFLTKDLLVHWKRGEEYFAQQLLDYDLAANNGGWQWSASTGCDAQPYFRIFHPVTQSEKFDPKGAFIRSICPELRQLPDDEIHFPSEESRPAAYPAPIVVHSRQRELALALFKGNK